MPVFAPELAEVAQLAADPARARMLLSLIDGREKKAGELAAVAGITPQTASSHLSKLLYRAFVTVEKRGPRRFYRLAAPVVAQTIEAIMTVATTGPPRFRPPSWTEDEVRFASICYDHLTGRLAVAITDALVERRHLVFDHDVGELTPSGIAFFGQIGIALHSPASRAFCRLCLDWSEQRLHLAGKIGAAVADLCLRRDWIQQRAEAAQWPSPMKGWWHLERCSVRESESDEVRLLTNFWPLPATYTFSILIRLQSNCGTSIRVEVF